MPEANSMSTQLARVGSDNQAGSFLARVIADAASAAQTFRAPEPQRPWLTLDEAEDASGMTASTLLFLKRERKIRTVGRGANFRISRKSIFEFEGE